MVTCKHLGEHVADTTPAKKRGCNGCKDTTAVFSCELHKLCTPVTDALDEAIRDCRTCEDRTVPPREPKKRIDRETLQRLRAEKQARLAALPPGELEARKQRLREWKRKRKENAH